MTFAQSKHQREISRLCAELELESDEFFTAEEKAERILRSRQPLRLSPFMFRGSTTDLSGHANPDY